MLFKQDKKTLEGGDQRLFLTMVSPFTPISYELATNYSLAARVLPAMWKKKNPANANISHRYHRSPRLCPFAPI